MSSYAFGTYNQKAQFEVASAIKKFNGISKSKFKDKVGFQMDSKKLRSFLIRNLDFLCFSILLLIWEVLISGLFSSDSNMVGSGSLNDLLPHLCPSTQFPIFSRKEERIFPSVE